MSNIWYDPNNLNSGYRSFLPALESQFQCEPLAGLEARTGADICLGTTPIPPDDVAWAIEQKYVFVQLKFGNDIFSFDQTKSEMARIQASGIPLQQAYLLFVGRCYLGASGEAMIDGKEAFKPTGGSTRPYKTFLELKQLAPKRGMLFDEIPSELELASWCESLFTSLAKIGREGTREVYPTRNQAIEVSDNVWQKILEVNRDDWRWTMVNGLDGFGPVLANNVQSYMLAHHLVPCLYEALRVLSELDEKGKPVHDIDGWGKGKRDELRRKIGLLNSWELPKENRPVKPFVQNITASYITDASDPMAAWQRGVHSAVSAFESAMKAGVSGGKELMWVVQRSASVFDSWTDETWREWRDGLYCDDWLKTKYPQIYSEFVNERQAK